MILVRCGISSTKSTLASGIIARHHANCHKSVPWHKTPFSLYFLEHTQPAPVSLHRFNRCHMTFFCTGMCPSELCWYCTPFKGSKAPNTNPFWGSEREVSSQAHTIFKLSYYWSYYSSSTQILYNNKHLQVVYVGYPKMCPTNPRWQMTTILKQLYITIFEQLFTSFDDLDVISSSLLIGDL